jgi:YqjK-like protein
MNRKLIQVAERREHLVAQAAAQRGALARDIEPWRIPLALTDQGLTALRYIRNHPKWFVGGIALLAILQPRNAGKWLGRGWVAWRLMNSLRVRSEGTIIPPKLTPHISTVAH